MAWEDVQASDDVPSGTVVGLEVGGLDLALWRSADGVLAACDARCPHQWSHLAGAGAVDGEELVCLSHFWRFDAAGHASKASMNGRRDPKGEIATFAVRELDGRIEVLVPEPPA